LAILLSKERVDQKVLNEILKNTIKDKDGEIILKEDDKYLLKQRGINRN